MRLYTQFIFMLAEPSRMKSLKLFTLFIRFALLFHIFPVLAQPKWQINSNGVTYDYLTTTTGLSSQRVFSIVDDKKGFIWISTRSGIDCFNGRYLKNYKLANKRDITLDAIGNAIYLTKGTKGELVSFTNTGNVHDRFARQRE